MEETQSPLIYTPQQPRVAPPPPPQYELKKDISGQPPVSRDISYIEVLIPDKKHKDTRIKVKVKVPFLPKNNCNVCYGRGYVGYVPNLDKVLLCHKCYK